MRVKFHACPESGVPPGRGPSSYAIKAINCLATIVKSLRYKKPTQLLRSSAKLALMGFNPRYGKKTYRPEEATELLAQERDVDLDNRFFFRPFRVGSLC
jgi:hypothetical protein